MPAKLCLGKKKKKKDGVQWENKVTHTYLGEKLWKQGRINLSGSF